MPNDKDLEDQLTKSSPVDADLQDAVNAPAEGSESPPAEGAEQEPAPGSSPDADGKKAPAEEPWDPLSAVKKALGKTPKDPKDGQQGTGAQESGESSQPGDGKEKQPQPYDGSQDLSDAEKKALHPKTRKRMEFLLSERQKSTDYIGQIEPLAEQHKLLTDFIQEQKLSTNEVAEMLVVGGLAKTGDPADLETAIVKTKEFLSKLELAAGHALPPELKKQVEEGALTEDAAKQLQRTKAHNTMLQNQVEHTQGEVAQRDEQKAVQSVTQAITNWQQTIATTDPDYQRKAPFLQQEIQLRVASEGKRGADGKHRVLDANRALQIAQEAKAKVDEMFKKSGFTPNKPPQPKRQLKSKVPPGNMATQPKSPLEAARAGLNKARAAD